MRIINEKQEREKCKKKKENGKSAARSEYLADDHDLLNEWNCATARAYLRKTYKKNFSLIKALVDNVQNLHYLINFPRKVENTVRQNPSSDKRICIEICSSV
jgi:hypothetical protein